ncbi:MAG TPA: hypothetical protein VJ718_10330, partial [Candidatus Binataceae bacterium]|nr:hypothetical protein [Candidatus Binataceae bacterium]
MILAVRWGIAVSGRRSCLCIDTIAGFSQEPMENPRIERLRHDFVDQAPARIVGGDLLRPAGHQ